MKAGAKTPHIVLKALGDRAPIGLLRASTFSPPFAMHRDGLSYRLIGRNLELSKNTVMEIVKRGHA